MMTWLLLGSGFAVDVVFTVVTMIAFLTLSLALGKDLSMPLPATPAPQPLPPLPLPPSVARLPSEFSPAHTPHGAAPLHPARSDVSHPRYPLDPFADGRGPLPERSNLEPAGSLGPGWRD